jgi:CubicO group peptidase (beta-lactamase class C family)
MSLTMLQKITCAVLIFITFVSLGKAQQIDMKNYEGGWLGTLESNDVFMFNIGIKKIKSSSYEFEVKNNKTAIKKDFQTDKSGFINLKIDSGSSFKGYINKNTIEGFLQTGIMQHHILLKKSGKDTYTAKWNLFLISDLNKEFFLGIENAEGDKYAAYSFSGDTRIPGFMNYDFNKKGGELYFKDIRTGIEWKAKLTPKIIFLDVNLFGKKITQVELAKTEESWSAKKDYERTLFNPSKPENLNDGWKISDIKNEGFDEVILRILIDSINSGNITNTHSILIARNGNLIFEKYFGGFNESVPHDMRSASKSISSAITGLAISKNYLKSVNEKLYDLLPEKYKYTENSDERKSRIKIKDLLTMSSGIDAVDFGTDKESAASEDVYQSSEDWVKTILEAPMINEPGMHSYYGTANPYLLGIALENEIKEPLEFFIHKNLFGLLTINNYLLQNDIEGRPYFGGGIYMTPRDMLKFGQMYLDKGKWNGKQIVPEEWVEESFGKYLVLENTDEKNEYGYLWWHYKYKSGNEIVESIEARGAGGQYIFVIPKYNITAVITSANFRNGRYWQPEKIMENYILPAIIKN